MSPVLETATQELTDEQRAAIEWSGGSYLLSAGAGSGKTAVIVERYLRLLLHEGLSSDGILVITFTEKAAAELRERIRTRLLGLDQPELALAVTGAPISTIHGFCARLLRAESLRAGVAPDFEVLSEYVLAQCRLEAFERALERSDDAAELLARYGESALRRTITAIYERLRTLGKSDPHLPAPADDDDAGAATVIARFDELLHTFSSVYVELKREHGGLDFADLELGARDLLAADPELCARYREQFAQIMVDEFQDTNPLQIELLELIGGDNVFAVGDELQSIYGFRGADVGVFRRWREQLRAAGSLGALTVNFRSERELLDLINLVFSASFADYDFAPLQAPLRSDESAASSPSVELLLTEHERWQETDLLPNGSSAGGPLWRVAEARLLAQRIAELIESGACEPGEVAVLMRARRQMSLFEHALAEFGVPTYVCGGSGFWSDRAVADVVAALSVLTNPLDELALYEVLASPLVAASSDTLALLARQARLERSGVWQGLERPTDEIVADQRERLQRFVELAQFLRTRSSLPLAGLIEQLISKTEFDLALLRQADGRRALANVRKLMRIAREFEASNGSDLDAFVRFLGLAINNADLAVQESVAPTEGEGVSAVRIMTIHQAKGLEFPVVAVADLGGRRNQVSEDLIVADDLSAVGLRLRDTGGGKGVPVLAYEQLSRQLGERELEEERRLFYVAMTRAQRRLILSGRRPEPRAPMGWIGPAVVPGLEQMIERGEGEQVFEREFEGRKTAVRCLCSSPENVDRLAITDRQPLAPPDGDPAQFRAAQIPVAPALPSPGAVPDRLSYSALSSYQQCGYRFALERIVGLPRNADDELLESGGAARQRGIEIHALLERIDFRTPVLPEQTPAQERELLAALLNSRLAIELAQAAELSQEVPFMFVREGLLLEGFIDLIAKVSGRTVVIDYKTDRLKKDCDLEAHIAAHYQVQRTIYALALLEQGAEAVEIVYWFLDRPDQPVTRHYTQADSAELRITLSALIEPLRRGEFSVASDPHAALCAGCPARRGLCKWDEAMTSRGFK